MKTLETDRLILRKFAYDDFESVHAYASVIENTVFMPWGPNTEDQTRAFIGCAIAKATEPPTDSQYAVILRESGRLIGGCDLSISGDEAEIGWIVHRDYWRRGFCTEMGKALLEYAFDSLGLRRVVAYCDAENEASWRVMEKIGMRREGYFIENRPPNKLTARKFSDGLSYAILRCEWDILKEIDYYNSLPVTFNEFADIPTLSDGEVFLVCEKKSPAIPEKKYVPSYNFAICVGGEKVGEINIRIGYTAGLYYGGQIGYNIAERYRGNGFAGRACRLLEFVAKAHGMKKLLISNDENNTASRRVCEKLGARHVRLARLPEWHELYKEGQRYINIFEWSVD